MKEPKSKNDQRKLLEKRVSERSGALIYEVCWALIETQSDFEVPPPWVAKAIYRCQTQGIEQLRRLIESLKTPLSPSESGEIAGSAEVKLAYLSESKNRREVRSEPSEEIGQRFAQAAKNCLASVASQSNIRTATLSGNQTAEFAIGVGCGALKARKEAESEDALSLKICTILWLCWKEASSSPDRRTLHSWLQETWRISCSFQLVEKICNEIGLHLATRGRPRKNHTPHKERVSIISSDTKLESGYGNSRPDKTPSGQTRPITRRSR